MTMYECVTYVSGAVAEAGEKSPTSQRLEIMTFTGTSKLANISHNFLSRGFVVNAEGQNELRTPRPAGNRVARPPGAPNLEESV